MEMLKKMALVLLLSGSCCLQAMYGDARVEWHDTSNPSHMRQHPEMYTHLNELRIIYNTLEKIAAIRALDAEVQAEKARTALAASELDLLERRSHRRPVLGYDGDVIGESYFSEEEMDIALKRVMDFLLEDPAVREAHENAAKEAREKNEAVLMAAHREHRERIRKALLSELK